MIFYFRYEKERLERQRVVEAAKGVGKPKVGGPFELVDQEGQKFTDEDMKGGYTLVSGTGVKLLHQVQASACKEKRLSRNEACQDEFGRLGTWCCPVASHLDRVTKALLTKVAMLGLLRLLPLSRHLPRRTRQDGTDDRPCCLYNSLQDFHALVRRPFIA